MREQEATSVYTSRGPSTGEDWAAVAAAVNDRMAARRVGQQELASLCGVSVSTLRQVQHGAGQRVQNKTLTAISRALDWPEDHLIDVLRAGRRPRPAQPARGEDQLATLARIENVLHEVTRRLDYIEGLLDPRRRGSVDG